MVDYGLFFSVLTFVLIFSIFRSLGLNQGLPRFIADYRIKKKNGEIKSLITGAFIMQFSIALIIVICMWIFSDFLAINYFKDLRASYLLRLLSLYLPLSIIYVNFVSIFQGLKKSKLFSLGQLSINLFTLIGVILGIYLGFEIFSPVLGYLGSFIIFLFIFAAPLLKNFKYFNYKQKHFFQENKKFLKFSFPLMITGAGALLITYIDTILLTYFDTLANVGIYNIIYPTALLIILIGSSLGSILLPVITELWILRKKEYIVDILKKINKYLLAFSLPILIILMFFSKKLINLFFGSDYVFGFIAFNILLIGALFILFTRINHQALIAMKEPKKIMYMYLFGALINIVLNIILIPEYSLTGASVASTISFIFIWIMSLYYMQKKISLQFPWRDWGITLFASGVIPLVLLITSNLFWNPYFSAGIGLIVAGLAYILILYKARIINMEEIKDVFLR